MACVLTHQIAYVLCLFICTILLSQVLHAVPRVLRLPLSKANCRNVGLKGLENGCNLRDLDEAVELDLSCTVARQKHADYPFSSLQLCFVVLGVGFMTGSFIL